jgi:hypothetical protein
MRPSSTLLIWASSTALPIMPGLMSPYTHNSPRKFKCAIRAFISALIDARSHQMCLKLFSASVACFERIQHFGTKISNVHGIAGNQRHVVYFGRCRKQRIDG